MTEEKKEQETTTKTALIELYNLKKDEHKDSPENLLKYATEVIKNSLPIFVSKTNSAWEHAKESKPAIKDALSYLLTWNTDDCSSAQADLLKVYFLLVFTLNCFTC